MLVNITSRVLTTFGTMSSPQPPQTEQLFLSYSRNDPDAATLLRHQLAQHGLDVFQDDKSIREGELWLERLAEAVKNCVSFVVLVGRDGVQSIVDECAEVGVGGCIVYASGYAETGKPERIAMHAALTATASRSATRIAWRTRPAGWPSMWCTATSLPTT